MRRVLETVDGHASIGTIGLAKKRPEVRKRLDRLRFKPIHSPRPSSSEAEEAVRTLIRWAGDDPAREGLCETPTRVVGAYREWCSGYALDPAVWLRREAEETSAPGAMVVLHDSRFESICEDHMGPIVGAAHVAYSPGKHVVDVPKLAKLVEAVAKRLQTQEKMMAQIADAIQDALRPRGVAVVIEARHQCMTAHGAQKPGVGTVTSRMLGSFRDDPTTRREFLAIIGGVGALQDHA
jgi:GTP cyclohydrolase IA